MLTVLSHMGENDKVGYINIYSHKKQYVGQHHREKLIALIKGLYQNICYFSWNSPINIRFR
jgi:hypothetical protein